MKDKKISIIIPVYNGEKSIIKCLKSIKNQKYNNIEAIVVDDGSNDATEDLCRQFVIEDDRFLYYKQKNSGVSSARNMGIEKATGEYIAFVDGDDYIDPNHLVILALGIINNDMSMVGYTQINEIKKNMIEYKFGDNQILSRYEMLKAIVEDIRISSVPWNKLYKASIIYDFNIRYNPTLKFGEDLEFNVSYISKIQQGIMLPFSTYRYIQHEENITGRIRNKSHLEDKLTDIQAILLSISHLSENMEDILEYYYYKMVKNGTYYYTMMKKFKLEKEKVIDYRFLMKDYVKKVLKMENISIKDRAIIFMNWYVPHVSILIYDYLKR